MREPSNATTQAIADKLLELRGASHWRRAILSWSLSDGCRFAVVLGPENPPIGGIALPQVSERTSVILRDIGLPQPQDAEPEEFPGWDHIPTFSLPLGRLIGEPNEQRFRLSSDASLDPQRLMDIVDFILSAEEKTRALASTVEETLDFARKLMPTHPSSPFVIPVGYCMLGRHDAADTFVAEQVDRSRTLDNPAWAELYERFAARLKTER